MGNKRLAVYGVLCAVCLAICSIGNVVQASHPIEKQKGRSKAVKKIMTTMTERQMIGQLFMIDSYASFDSLQIKKVWRQIDSNYVGGVCFFKGNMKDLARMNKLYNQRSNIPLFVAIDGEWGLNMRLNDAVCYPMAMTLGALPEKDLQDIYSMGYSVGQQCRSLGININFAPDADVNINSDNPVINMRSFGHDAKKVALCVKNYFQGMQDCGVMGVVKHFPGHGDTKTDSHKATPIITHDRDFLDSVDIYPFKYAIENDVWGVMMGHLEVAALTHDTMIPASVNKEIISGYLADELDFEGLVFTDAMNMKGLTSLYGHGEAEVMALLAGADVILMPENIDTAIAAIEKALNEGRISRKLLKEKCKKILNWKYDMGILTQQCSYTVPDSKIINQSNAIAAELYDKAVTPFNIAGKQIANKYTSNDTDNDTLVLFGIGTTDYDTLINDLKKHNAVVFYRLTQDMASKSFDNIFASLPANRKVYTLIAGGKFAKSSAYYGVPKGTFSILNRLKRKIKSDNNLLLFANAYFLRYIDTSYHFNDILVAYENNSFTQHSMAKVLNKEIIPQGELPVKIDINVSDVEALAEYADTATEYISNPVLRSIDSIACEGVKQRAYPGCQVLIAKDGKIIFEKNYGYQTYDSLLAVTDNTVYDIASVTKVMATTLAVMKLYEQGKIKLDATVKTYLPEYKHCKFGKLTVRELLSHYSTLPATYLFWTKTLKDGKLDNNLYDYNVFMDENYIPVTDTLFIKKSHLKTMRKQLKDVKLKERQYTYSDLNFLLLQYIVESVSGQSLDEYLQQWFYGKMNLEHTYFNPLDKGVNKQNIAPTENDTVFRHQLIHGTVHDPMASLHGGVCGNAGLFSTAHDIYRICRMLINNGELDGVRYLDSATVATFNKRYYADKNVRRALGFDKPFISSVSTHCSKYASQSSYGHSGFTGTYFWIDPANNTVFIFLSNRVNPSATPNKLASMNIRTDIHDLIYKLQDE